MLWFGSSYVQEPRARIHGAVGLARYVAYLWIRRVPEKSGHV
jgi:hypothetical protein